MVSKSKSFPLSKYKQAYDEVFYKKIDGEKNKVKMMYDNNRKRLFVGTDRQLSKIKDGNIIFWLSEGDFDITRGRYGYKKMNDGNILLAIDQYTKYYNNNAAKQSLKRNPATLKQKKKYNIVGDSIAVVTPKEFYDILIEHSNVRKDDFIYGYKTIRGIIAETVY